MNVKVSCFRRLRNGALIGLAAAAVAAPSAGAAKYIAGYTDFPNALRLQHQSSYIAGYTDFPNALRLADVRATAAAPARSTAGPAQSSASTFNWGDAGIGAGSAIGAGLLLVGMGVAFRSRTRTVRTH
jgi:hypothetical protein